MARLIVYLTERTIMKKTVLTLTGALALATPAAAHDGDHSLTLLANIGHWLSSPTHALFSVIGVIALTVLAAKIMRKKA